MNFYEETIEIYEDLELKAEEKEIAFCKIIIKLMKDYTHRYSIEEIKNYLIFVMMLFRDVLKTNYNKGKSLHQLNIAKKRQIYNILYSEL